LYKPKILWRGRRDHLPDAEIVGEISFRGAAERGEFIIPAHTAAANNFTVNAGDFQIFFEGTEISIDFLRKILNDVADYIVIESHDEYLLRFRELYALGLIDRVITLPTLLNYATDNFFSLNNAVQIFNLIHALKLFRTLDVDGFFAKNDYYMFPDFKSKIAGIADTETYPALENFYGEIYSSLDDCRYKFFDALLITNDRTPEEFINVLVATDLLAENILIFARKNSALEDFLIANENAFEKISMFPAVNGNWLLLKKVVRADCKIYVVTHKNAKLFALPKGYKIIHAGHALAQKNFGYLGDDTGDNISRLNPYLNEITALYWLWKNTSHNLIGFVHYRRFFTADGENILTTDKAKELLRENDIIVNGCEFGYVALYDWKIMLSGRKIAEHVMNTIRKYIAARQPDYLAAYDRVTNSFGVFCYEIFITRWEIFNGYCEWLFSFIIDAAEEILATSNLASSDDPREYRAISFVAEHLLTVWLIKNRLQVKTLPIIFHDNI